MDQEKIIEILIKRGNKSLREPYKELNFTFEPEADQILNNIDQYPHAFALACIMDRQIKAEKAWLIPYIISQEIGSPEFEEFANKDLRYFKRKFKKNYTGKCLHRMNDQMAKYFYLGIKRIHNEYDDNASNIWSNKPKSATIMRRFLEFDGVGIKIASMATNILARSFKIPMEDRICIDISPDVHVRRVFKRIGFVQKNATVDEVIYYAKELNPKYPGVFDDPVWEIGTNWCRPQRPLCDECYLNEYCPKII